MRTIWKKRRLVFQIFAHYVDSIFIPTKGDTFWGARNKRRHFKRHKTPFWGAIIYATDAYLLSTTEDEYIVYHVFCNNKKLVYYMGLHVQSLLHIR